MSAFFLELRRRHAPLAWASLVLAGFFVLCVLLSFFDPTLITGINRWYKPAKFASSLAIYLGTLGWLLHYLKEAAPRGTGVIAWGTLIMMVIEYVAVFGQAARGTTSHYNISTLFDAIVFQTMGIAIALNTFLLVYMLWLYLRHRPDLPAAYLWGIRLGLLLLIIFGAEGALMISNNGHAVGAPEDVPGLPFLGWSRQGGDLRFAHFVGMHAFQVLPLTGWLLQKYRARLALVGVAVVATLHFLLALWLMLRALSGQPIL